MAISRAEDHLRLYHTLQAAKEARVASPFLADLGGFVPETLDGPPADFPLPAHNVGSASLGYLTLHDVRDFEKCPLRVAYRHQLSIRSRRHESPYQRTGGALYEVIDRVSEIADDGAGVMAALEAAFAVAWAERGPDAEHPLRDEYEVVGRRDLAKLHDLIVGHEGSGTDPIRLPIRGGHVLVPPPLLSRDPGKPRTARMVTVGKRKTENAKTLAARLFLAAATLRQERRIAAEIAHLTDGGIVAITRSDQEMELDLEEAAAILDAVRSGRLEPKPSLQVCMRCGHFVSCPATGARRTV